MLFVVREIQMPKKYVRDPMLVISNLHAKALMIMDFSVIKVMVRTMSSIHTKM